MILNGEVQILWCVIPFQKHSQFSVARYGEQIISLDFTQLQLIKSLPQRHHQVWLLST